MGELHLEIYIERMRREYSVDFISGKPEVAYRETLTQKVPFEYVHKKQTGGAGQYAKVCGYLEPITYEDETNANEFTNATIGGSIPPEFIPACQKGFYESVQKGPLTAHKIVGVRMVINDGAWHPVDSSELAFRTATWYAFRETFRKAHPIILEPIMKVEVTAPSEYQGLVISSMNKRKGVILTSDVMNDYICAVAEVPLSNMFGYSTDLRSMTQGKGEFTMEYLKYNPMSRDQQEELVKQIKKKEDKK